MSNAYTIAVDRKNGYAEATILGVHPGEATVTRYPDGSVSVLIAEVIPYEGGSAVQCPTVADALTLCAAVADAIRQVANG